jgi:hypothetical protein
MHENPILAAEAAGGAQSRAAQSAQLAQMLAPQVNPILAPPVEPAADLVDFTAPSVHRRELQVARRDLRDMRRSQTAAEAIGPLTRDVEIYGFTKGQFSIIDILHHCLAATGPGAHLQISTWTAANADISTVLELCNSGKVASARWLVDLTFNRRSPELAQRIRNVFGDDAIRVAKNHAKFVLLSAGEWRLVIRTSMNLNFHPRFENFQLAHDPELWAFHDAILSEVWKRQKRADQDELRPYELHRQFNTDL